MNDDDTKVADEADDAEDDTDKSSDDAETPVEAESETA